MSKGKKICGKRHTYKLADDTRTGTRAIEGEHRGGDPAGGVVELMRQLQHVGRAVLCLRLRPRLPQQLRHLQMSTEEEAEKSD